jgi:hypothetical protein
MTNDAEAELNKIAADAMIEPFKCKLRLLEWHSKFLQPKNTFSTSTILIK